MNKDKIKTYSIVAVVIFLIAYLSTSFVVGSFLLPQGGRFAIIMATLFGTCIYALVKENPEL